MIGFDTFEGYTLNFHEKDSINEFELAQFKSFNRENVSTLAELEVPRRNFNADRHIKQFEKIKLVIGDASKIIPMFVKENPRLIVSLLICGTDIYSPTYTALKHFDPLMPKGAVVLFGATSFDGNLGGTAALKDVVGIDAVRLERFDFATKWS